MKIAASPSDGLIHNPLPAPVTAFPLLDRVHAPAAAAAAIPLRVELR